VTKKINLEAPVRHIIAYCTVHKKKIRGKLGIVFLSHNGYEI
jgi:hypothetical protein